MDVSIRHTSTSRDLRHMEAAVYTRCLKYAQLSDYESIWSIFRKITKQQWAVLDV